MMCELVLEYGKIGIDVQMRAKWKIKLPTVEKVRRVGSPLLGFTIATVRKCAVIDLEMAVDNMVEEQKWLGRGVGLFHGSWVGKKEWAQEVMENPYKWSLIVEVVRMTRQFVKHQVEQKNADVWALGLSCEAPAALGPPELHTNSIHSHFRVPALQTPPKFHEKTPKEGRKNENCSGRGKKSAKFWVSHPSLPLPFGAAFFWVRVPNPFGATLFLGLGPSPCGPPPFGPPP